MISMFGATGSEQDGARFGRPFTSTTQMKQEVKGTVSFMLQRVGILNPFRSATLKIVSPSCASQVLLLITMLNVLVIMSNVIYKKAVNIKVFGL